MTDAPEGRLVPCGCTRIHPQQCPGPGIENLPAGVYCAAIGTTEDRLAEEGSTSAPAYSSEALYLVEQIILATGGDLKTAPEAAVMLDVFAAKGMINPEREQRVHALVDAARAVLSAWGSPTGNLMLGATKRAIPGLRAAVAAFDAER